MERLLVLLLRRIEGECSGRLDIVDGDLLLRFRLVHGDGNGTIFAVCRFLRERIRWHLRQADGRNSL